MPTPSCSVLLIKQTEQALTGFASLLQYGIVFHRDRPVDLVPFLLDLPGFSKEYIERTVQTIFINGVAADSLDRELPPGSTLALSAAMPGLAGAIFRRQGLHGSLRSQTPEKPVAPPGQSGYITLKLFNMIAADRILDLLKHGICVTGLSLVAFAANREALLQPPAALFLDHEPVSPRELLQAAVNRPFLTVRASLLPG
ncbi:hypothetical protein [Desulfobulbus alkaliphilus]|uniref:hypothetical protein n=1 Tax=Desulfobulbus alkaliphilus TaxID=869814 RepID=UPI00196502CE|nr:hypothetical protein [Desulfobulbus alkaliphilus]MBM9536329.1 hypothetical protein [Desulfobulbus alkaliphilus]